ncbi:hypothetical protein [uncultured Tateyamaria sp.]|uniref:hypothetical protein n=1 Tax=uncultured Tateyamaria sp. TaxID=455651 RepID=UPI002615090C|nr:hypothetical protein [uncultured Tateyamaria sp.]
MRCREAFLKRLLRSTAIATQMVSDQGRKFLEMFVLTMTAQPSVDAPATDDAAEALSGDADVTPFQKAKAEWERTRKDLNGQMKALQSAILKRCAQIGITGIKGETDELLRQLGGLDQALEDALQTVIASPDAETRQGNQKAAGKVADKMLKELNSPFSTPWTAATGFAAWLCGRMRWMYCAPCVRCCERDTAPERGLTWARDLTSRCRRTSP